MLKTEEAQQKRAPVYSEVSHLVYTARSSNNGAVIINGKIIMENRELATLNTQEGIDTVEKSKKQPSGLGKGQR